jgi:hypothetical protein
MRTLSQNEVTAVSGAAGMTLADLINEIGKTLVNVSVVGKPTGSTNVTVQNNLVDVLVNVIWGKK